MVRRFLSLLALAGLWLAASCAQPPGGKAHTPEREPLPLSGAVPAAEAGTDARTGLPTRIVHQASGIVLVLIPAGEFQMGSPVEEAGRGEDERQHRRVIRAPFYLGETEVTAGQFANFAQATGYRTDAERGTEESGHGQGAFAATPDGNRDWSAAASWRNPFPNLPDHRPQDGHPVVHVSWNDAQQFCTRFGLRLPSEAQWEYANRAGGRERFSWGDSAAGGKGFSNVHDATATKRFATWNFPFPFDDGAALLSAAGIYRPNAWGLRDMTGNVAEWCQDAYREDYPADGADESAAQGDSRSIRVLRGCSWVDSPDLCRSAARAGFYPYSRRDFVGFRVVRTLDSSELQ
jgi:formylglycine-generating enzyme required for sulfatase activity